MRRGFGAVVALSHARSGQAAPFSTRGAPRELARPGPMPFGFGSLPPAVAEDTCPQGRAPPSPQDRMRSLRPSIPRSRPLSSTTGMLRPPCPRKAAVMAGRVASALRV